MKGSSSIMECLFFCNKLDLKSAHILKIPFFKKKTYTIWQNQIKNRLDAIKCYNKRHLLSLLNIVLISDIMNIRKSSKLIPKCHNYILTEDIKSSYFLS